MIRFFLFFFLFSAPALAQERLDWQPLEVTDVEPEEETGKKTAKEVEEIQEQAFQRAIEEAMK